MERRLFSAYLTFITFAIAGYIIQTNWVAEQSQQSLQPHPSLLVSLWMGAMVMVWVLIVY